MNIPHSRAPPVAKLVTLGVLAIAYIAVGRFGLAIDAVGGFASRVSLESDGKVAHVAVRDEGDGIAPDRLEGIFERFHRVAIKEHAGLGLGLYIARWLAEAHQGRLTATSAEHGSVFTLIIPVLGDSAPVEQAGQVGRRRLS